MSLCELYHRLYHAAFAHIVRSVSEFTELGWRQVRSDAPSARVSRVTEDGFEYMVRPPAPWPISVKSHSPVIFVKFRLLVYLCCSTRLFQQTYGFEKR